MESDSCVLSELDTVRMAVIVGGDEAFDQLFPERV